MKRRGLYFLNTILPVSLLCFLWTVTGKAQINGANLNGTVTDPSGASVPNAKVEVVSPDTGFERQVITGDSGIYVISSLPTGKYHLTISCEGIKTFGERGIELFVGQTRTVDAQLVVGAATETVEVRGTAQAIESNDAEVSSVLQSRQVDDIPLNGRNWSTLAMQAPGTVNLGGGGQRDLRFVGRGTNDNNYTFDGVGDPGSNSSSGSFGIITNQLNSGATGIGK